MSLVTDTRASFEARLEQVEAEIAAKVGPLQQEAKELREMLGMLSGETSAPTPAAAPRKSSGPRKGRATAEEMEARKKQVAALLQDHSDMSVANLSKLLELSYQTTMQTTKGMMKEGLLDKDSSGAWKVLFDNVR